MVIAKKCSKCGVWKQASEFDRTGRSTNTYSGYQGKCKKCRWEKQKEWYGKQGKEIANQNQNAYNQTLGGLATLLLLSAKRRSKLRSLKFDLDKDWMLGHLSPMKCEATGMQLVLTVDKDVMHTYNRPSIDRRDNYKGYTKDNCQIVSVIYNKAKSDGTHNHVMEMLSALGVK